MSCNIEGCTREATEEFESSIHSLPVCNRHYIVARLLKVVAYGTIALLLASPFLLGWFIL